METAKTNKTKLILTRALALLALPVVLSAVTGMVRMQSPAELAAENSATQAISAIERVFQSDWGSADPDVYARIAFAFSAEAMNGAELKRVECRRTLCKVVYEADRDIKVNRILPRQLAASFNSMVTVHAGQDSDDETLVYLDVPSRT